MPIFSGALAAIGIVLIVAMATLAAWVSEDDQ